MPSCFFQNTDPFSEALEVCKEERAANHFRPLVAQAHLLRQVARDRQYARDQPLGAASGCGEVEKCRRSSAMSLAVVNRSDARFDNALRQIRSSSFGMASSICRGGRGSIARDLFQQFGLRIRLERSPSDQQFVEDHPQAENITAAIDSVSFASGLFGTHIGGRTGEAWPLPIVLFPQRQSEIPDERFTAACRAGCCLA